MKKKRLFKLHFASQKSEEIEDHYENIWQGFQEGNVEGMICKKRNPCFHSKHKRHNHSCWLISSFPLIFNSTSIGHLKHKRCGQESKIN